MVGLLCATACALLLAPAAAQASTYTVNNTGDALDANPGNNVCATAGAVCTLRAAITEANDHAGADEIRFGSAIFEDKITRDFDLNGAYDVIGEQVKIDGCSSAPGHAGPCVTLQGEADTDPALLEVNADDVTIKGLAIGNSLEGVVGLDGADDLTIRNNWFGLDVDANSNTLDSRGISLFSGDRARIGGSGGATHRNVVTNTGTGLRIAKGDDAKVQGNIFGLEPDGTTLASNVKNIEIVAESGDSPERTLVGGRVTSAQAATTKCDGACNVISGAADLTDGYGIDMLTAEGSPTAATTIAGNFIGLDRFGTEDRGNAHAGVSGQGGGITIGGSSSRDRNFIAGNGTGASTDNSGVNTFSTDTVVKRNWFGVSSSGASPIPNRYGAMSMRAAVISRNRVAGDGVNAVAGIGVSAPAPTVIKGNKIGVCANGDACGFTSFGVEIQADGVVVGGPNAGDGNTIAHSGTGLDVSAVSNTTVQGNYIGTDSAGTDRGNADNGISIRSFGTFAADNTVIGGSTSGSENVISFNGGDAIEILDQSGTGLGDGNVIKRNRGRGNGLLFIDLNPANGTGVAGSGVSPNNGITAPTIGSATKTKASGSGLVSGDKVRVFKTTSPGSGRIDRFLCSDDVGTGGNWSCAYASSVSSGGLITATRTDSVGNTSELSSFITVP